MGYWWVSRAHKNHQTLNNSLYDNCYRYRSVRRCRPLACADPDCGLVSLVRGLQGTHS